MAAQLFEPFDIKQGLALKNRLVCPPMVTLRNVTTDSALEWYREKAHGGVGMVIVEATSCPRYGKDITMPILTRLAEAVHAEGAKIGMQLFPVATLFDGVPDAPQSPADMTLAQIRASAVQMGAAVRMLHQAGFDAVEAHGAHGFLLNQFFSPEDNKRTDEYGGQSLANRMRFAVELVHAMSEANADGRMAVYYRHGPVGHGYTIEDSVELARALYAAGLDVLDLSPDSAALGLPFRAVAPLPGRRPLVIQVVGGLDDTTKAVAALESRNADLIAVGKQLIADPEWPRKVQEGRLADIERCVHCHGCLQRCIFANPPQPAHCVVAAAKRKAKEAREAKKN